MTAECLTREELVRLFENRARTFCFAARWLPRAEYEATVALYAFFRTLDDLMDDTDSILSPEQRLTVLAAWRVWLDGGPPPPGQQAIADCARRTLDEFAVPHWIISAFLDGMETDARSVRLASFEELYRYAFRVAGTVGLAMAHVLGATSPAALRCATNLGIAMQLTNVLRDIGSDLAHDRVYLPSDELTMFGYSADRLFEVWCAQEPPDQVFRSLLDFQIIRARAFYQRGLAGIRLLPEETRPSILLAGRLYRDILGAIARDPGAVLYRRAATTRWHKLRVAAATLALLRIHPQWTESSGAEAWAGAADLRWLDLTLDESERPIPPAQVAHPGAA